MYTPSIVMPFTVSDLHASTDAYRVPVEWRDAVLLIADGSRQAVRLSMGKQAAMRDLLESEERFLPVLQADEFRLYARTTIMCITVSAREPVQLDDTLPLTFRGLRVHLTSGVTIDGKIGFVPVRGRARVTDVLNEPPSSFCLHHADGASYVAKDHVVYVEERTP